jgi:hypothetical protein
MTTIVPQDADLGPEFARARGCLVRTHLTAELEPLADALAVALVEMGFTLHACPQDSPARHLGGVCLTPVSAQNNPAFAGIAGIAVTWTQHDRRAHWPEGPDSLDQDGNTPAQAPPVYGRGYPEVKRTMNVALSVALAFVGFTMREFGSAGAILVTAAPEPGFGQREQTAQDTATDVSVATTGLL